jgi:uncharacterized phiE125 gp8 family phage protein
MPTRRIPTSTAPAEPLTLAEAKTHLRADCADEDGLITSFITAARAACEDRLQRSIVSTQWLLTVDRFPACGGPLKLLMPPIVSVASVQYIDQEGAVRTLDPADYLVDLVSEPGGIVPGVSKAWPTTLERINSVEVAYTAGYPAGGVPAPIKAWITLALGDLYDNRARSAEKPVVPQNFADSLLDTYWVWSY